MKTTVDIQGLDGLQGTLRGFSERRLRAVAATLLTRSAKELVGDWNGELFANIDRPTSYTLNSPAMTRATADHPVAEIFIKDKPPRAGAPSPADWLDPQEHGGNRFTKKFELLLMRNGNMPAGHKVVPGPYAKLDGYGNISRSQITQVITQLGVRDANVAPGYAQTVSAKAAKRLAAAKRAARRYVAVVRKTGRLRPGIYERSGRQLLPVMFFVTQVQYHQRIDLEGNTMRDAPAILQREGDRAIAEHIARLESQGRR